MGRRRYPKEKDRVLRFAVMAVFLLFAVGGSAVWVRMQNPRVDASEGRQRLKDMESVDIEAIDVKIQELAAAELAAEEERKARPIEEKFAAAIVLGDSVTKSLYEYGALSMEYVRAGDEACVSNAGESGLTDLLDQVIEAAPSTLFIAIGIYDIAGSQGDEKAFIKAYKAMLDTLRGSLPYTTIYINSILPASAGKIGEDSLYEKVPKYNEELRELCYEEGLIYIDNTDLVQEEYYEQDGIHMLPNYYPGWVDRMADVAKL